MTAKEDTTKVEETKPSHGFSALKLFKTSISGIKEKVIQKKFKKKKVEKIKSPTATKFEKTSLKNRLISTLITIVISIVVLAIVFYIGMLVVLYANTNLEQISSSKFKALNWDMSSRVHILLIGADEQENGYVFIDYLSLVIIDPTLNEVKIVNISTYFSPYPEEINLRSAYAFGNTSTEANGLSKLVTGVEYVSSTKVDGYVFVTKNGFEQLFSDMGKIDVIAPSDVLDYDLPDGVSIKKGGNEVKIKDLVYFAAADSAGFDDKHARQLSSTEALIEQFGVERILFRSDLAKFKELFEQNVKTNLTKMDMLKIFGFIKLDKNLKYRQGFNRWYPGYEVVGSVDERWLPVIESLDNDLGKVLVSNDAKIEQARIDILNSTSMSGLAGQRARWLENRGLRVTFDGNYPTQIEKTQIYLENPENYKNTLYEIKQTFRSDFDIVEKNFPGRSVGNIVIILGENELMQ